MYLGSKAAVEIATLATLAPFVIAARATSLMFDVANPSAGSRRERDLMVDEKFQAAAESMFAMNVAAARLGFEAAFGAMRIGTHVGFLGGLDQIAAAGLRPYSSRVRANRTRLSR